MDDLLKALHCLKNEVTGECAGWNCEGCLYWQDKYVGYVDIIKGAITKIELNERK
nr:MAG TPA: hypothetical protein [Caudoviricetes sp.]